MPNHPIHQAWTLLREGRFQDALPLLDEIVSVPAGDRDGESVTIAHFLLGFVASRVYWPDRGSPGAARPYPPEVHQQVIRHFTAFLDHPDRDRCLVMAEGETCLNLGEPETYEGRLLLNEFHNRWAAFPDFGRASVLRRDDISLALDRRALAYHLTGRPLDAAHDLQAALKWADWTHDGIRRMQIVEEYYEERPDDPRTANLQGWIGWLLFDAGEYSEAATYLAACHAAMQPDDKLAEEEGITKELAKLRTWFDFICGGYYSHGHVHAFWEIGEWEGNGFGPTQSLAEGADGFLFRLGLSLLLAGRDKEALPHLDECVAISPTWGDAKVVRDLASTDPEEAKKVAEVILAKFHTEQEANRGS